MDLIKLPADGVAWTRPTITFQGYKNCEAAATQIAEYISNIELTKDNVKDVKKVLADARKVTNGLNRKRIDIKNDILDEYKGFEDKVKALVGIIDEADAKLRDKVKEIEEEEREEKKQEIFELWEKRVSHYRVNDYVPEAFDLWLTPQHLNKSTSMKTIEADMTEWLQETETAFETLDGMDDEYTVEYIGCLNLPLAIQAVNERRDIRKRVETDEEQETVLHFIVKGEKDITLTKLLLEQNGIDYEVI